jgi:rare lipoprotein A
MRLRGGWQEFGEGVVVAAILSTLASACASRTQPPVASPPAPLTPAKERPPRSPTPLIGVASWYGPGFNGQKTSSGEIYNQNEMTAACKRFRLGTRVMVTNLDNGRSVAVRINDHGPYLKGRTIDLSKRAAQILGITQMGTARVRITALGNPRERAEAQKDMTYALQFGSFTERTNADWVLKRVKGAYPDARIEETDSSSYRFYRVRAGNFATREAAQSQAERTAAPDLSVVIITE